MLKYILRKLLLSIPLLWGVVTLIFLLIQASPGDATDRFFTPETPPKVREMIEAKWGLDQPVYVQYVRMIGNIATGDFGRSIAQDRPVFDIIGDALWNTVLLSLISMIVTYSVGILLGVLQAVRQYSLLDSVSSVVSLFLYSMPGFWLALMMVLVFTLKWPILPSTGMIDAAMFDFMTPQEQWMDRLRHIILPAIALGLSPAAGIARYMRSSMLEVVRQDFVRTAAAKGLPGWKVTFKHALRNALLPIITIIGLNLPFLFSGAVLIETIFAWPGMGRVIVTAIYTQDTPLIVACFFVSSLLVVAGNLLADVLYSFVDPRIRLS